jgi:hypothetical protein
LPPNETELFGERDWTWEPEPSMDSLRFLQFEGIGSGHGMCMRRLSRLYRFQILAIMCMSLRHCHLFGRGMRLAQDVVNFSGQVLLYKGNPLQPKDIKNFKAWGIIEIIVESSSLNSSNSLDNNRIDAKLLVEAQNQISSLF